MLQNEIEENKVFGIKTSIHTDQPETIQTELRPKYYGGEEYRYEVFKVLEAWELDKDFYLGNVIKYLARAGKKNPDTKKEDLMKAMTYLKRRIESL